MLYKTAQGTYLSSITSHLWARSSICQQRHLLAIPGKAAAEMGEVCLLVAPSTKPCPRLLRLQDVAEYLSLSTRKVRDLVHQGELPVVQFGENAPWLIDISDLDQLINRYKRTA